MAEWKINGDLPYLEEFPEMYLLSAPYPNAVWSQKLGELPTKAVYPELANFSAPYPNAMWLQKTEELPYKQCFLPLYKPVKEKKAKTKKNTVKIYEHKEFIKTSFIKHENIIISYGF